MKKIIILSLILSFILSACSDKTEESGGGSAADTTSSTTAAAAPEKEPEATPNTEEVSDEHKDPYQLEKAILSSDGENEDGVYRETDDSDHYDKIDEMERSKWAEYYAEKNGTDADKITPSIPETVKAHDATAYLDCYYLNYSCGEKPFSICVVNGKKYKDTDELLKKYTESDGFSVKSEKTYIENGIIIDKSDVYENGYLLSSLNSDGLEYEVFSLDKNVTLDDMKDFLNKISF